MDLQGFLERLAIHLTSWQATTFLVGEYTDSESAENAVFTVADGILWLHQSVERNSRVRKLQVMKMRGQAPLPGLHTVRITSDGLQVFPQNHAAHAESPTGPLDPNACRSAFPRLDAMLGGGIPAWDSLLVTGPAGSGKSALATHFIAAGSGRWRARR